jgi:hypothetical protein
LLTRIHGNQSHDGFGFAAGSAGDVDADGLPDLVVSRYGEDLRGGVTVFSGARSPATWLTYGDGWPGTGGTVPTLDLVSAPTLCSTVDLRIGNSRPVATPAVMLLGPSPSSIPTALGGTLLVLPKASVTFTVPQFPNAIPFAIPCPYDLVGANYYLQVLELDPGASQGVSFTRGLQMHLGY